ncbi:MAG TPA: ABC transporter substrate-binding protein [Methylomirabilota bacterium]|nr:ABC transporter substrate-binding protein [Methylomirabilota bacterium]
MGARVGFLALAVILLGAPAAGAQDASRPYRVGFLGPYGPGLDWSMLSAYQERLRELGWVEGQNIWTTYRWADGDFSQFPKHVEALMDVPLDLLVLPCGSAVTTARARSPDIPIVAGCIDLVGFGKELDSLARPGGFTTGFTYFSPAGTARRLDLLRELLPRLSRVGLLYHGRSSWVAHLADVESAAAGANVAVRRLEWRDPGDLRATFGAAKREGVHAVMTLGDSAAHFYRHYLFKLAAEHRLPVIYDFPMFPSADEVGLIAYYADVAALYRISAEQVDQILRGRKPGDIPLAVPQKLRLLINEKAARALGLSISPALRQQADQVLD